jgi:hypothetical protein
MSLTLRLSLVAGLVSFLPAQAAAPFQTATITRLENSVFLGDTAKGSKSEHPAAVSDVVKNKEYVFTATDSRAELEFPDRSLVRIGQNSVFSFESESRTLSLEKGAMLFYIPPGNGGQIKTPSITAAVTGTIAKVLPNLIAVISGQLNTPWGIVEAGYAIENVNGRVRIFRYNPLEASKGKLYAWGPLPELPETGAIYANPIATLPDLHWLDLQEMTQVNPRVNHFKPAPTPRPEPTPTSEHQPHRARPTPTPFFTPTPFPTPPFTTVP